MIIQFKLMLPAFWLRTHNNATISVSVSDSPLLSANCLEVGRDSEVVLGVISANDAGISVTPLTAIEYCECKEKTGLVSKMMEQCWGALWGPMLL